jgi:hypothetical protein
MEQHYPVHYQGGLSHQYWFVSVGKRNVIKSVKLTLSDEELKIYNLSLMDLDVDSGWLSDEVVTNNGDTLKVLKTMAYCMKISLEIQSDASIYFTRNSPARNRLYKMYMNNYRFLWEASFEVTFIEKEGLEYGFYCKKM